MVPKSETHLEENLYSNILTDETASSIKLPFTIYTCLFFWIFHLTFYYICDPPAGKSVMTFSKKWDLFSLQTSIIISVSSVLWHLRISCTNLLKIPHYFEWPLDRISRDASLDIKFLDKEVIVCFLSNENMIG